MLGLLGLARLPDSAKFTKDDFDTAVILADAISTAITPLYSFLAYALKDKTQENGNDYDGFPVNVKALKKIYSRNVNDEYDYTTSLDVYGDDGKVKDTVELDIRSMDNAEVKEFDDYIKSLDEPVYIESAVREIAESAGEKCLSGTETAEQAAEETMKQLELRMKE